MSAEWIAKLPSSTFAGEPFSHQDVTVFPAVAVQHSAASALARGECKVVHAAWDARQTWQLHSLGSGGRHTAV